ncbi:putative reverse transcriptase domain-containing protein, partial [Tanacetum coccineum]
MESELWNLTVKNNDLAAYTQRFQELTMILQDAIRIANNLMDQKLKGYAVKNAENKRRLEVDQRDNHGQQPPFKRQNVRGQNVARACTAGNNEKRGYAGPLPYCSKFKESEPWKQSWEKTEEARGKAYVLGAGEANPDLNVVMDVSYAVELADERISKTNTILRGYTLGLLGHPFNIDLMPVELGSFDVIIDMDWLANHHAVIVCDEKIVWIPYGDEVLIVQGNSSDKEKKSKLSIISCTKTQKYIKRGCLIFLAQITKKETEDKSKEKRLEDVPIVRDFLEVFPEELLRLPPMQQVEFQIDIIPGAAPVARASYRLAPSKL